MTDALWTRLADIVPDALERPRAERDTYLREVCASDVLGDELLAEARSLVAAAEAADHDHALDPPAGALGSELGSELGAELAPPLPDRVGPWRIRGLLGEGGQGVVYRAERADGLYDRTVALKRLRPGLGGAHARRLDAERRLLARLEHPGIARLYDADVDGAGTPYVVMELVDGAPLTDYADAHGLGVRARLALFLDVCDAVAFAHGQLVVHRDLKPSNVFVTDEGAVKLLDFGIAKLIADEDASDVLTQTQRVLTPAYAAPEQVRGGAITTATDVYALGVTLFELLAGRRPYSLSGTTAAETERIVCEVAPPLASTVAPEGRARALRGDLDVVVAKALEKEPARRYASAEALAADLRRVLGGLPIEARPASRAYRARLFVRRHRSGVAWAAGLAAAVLVGLGGTVWQARAAAAERDLARDEADKAQAVTAFLQTTLLSASPTSGPAVRPSERRIGDVLRPAAQATATAFADRPGVRAAVLQTLGTAYIELGLWDDAERALLTSRALLDSLHGDAPHPDRAQAYDALGRLELWRGRSADSRRWYAEALRQRQAVFGAWSVEVVNSLWKYAEALHDDGALGEAERVLLHAIAVAEEAAGPQSIAAAEARHVLSLLYLTTGREDEALPILDGLVTLGRQVLPPDDPDLVMVIGHLALAHLFLGDLDAAERLNGEALRAQSARFDAGHTVLEETRGVRAAILLERGRYAEAEGILRRAAAAFEAGFDGPGHYEQTIAAAGLGAAIAGQGRLAEAEPVLRQATDRLREQLGDGNGWTRFAARRLADLYARTGRPDAAATYRALAAPPAAARP